MLKLVKELMPLFLLDGSYINNSKVIKSMPLLGKLDLDDAKPQMVGGALNLCACFCLHQIPFKFREAHWDMANWL